MNVKKMNNSLHKDKAQIFINMTHLQLSQQQPADREKESLHGKIKVQNT